MDAQNYQEKINYITTFYVGQLVAAGHVPSTAAGLLVQELTDTVDGWLQADQEDKTNQTKEN